MENLAKIEVSFYLIERCLKFPDECSIVGIYADDDNKKNATFIVKSKCLPEIQIGDKIPMAIIAHEKIYSKIVLLEDGSSIKNTKATKI